jgi:lysophospholipase L1-like esterase
MRNRISERHDGQLRGTLAAMSAVYFRSLRALGAVAVGLLLCAQASAADTALSSPDYLYFSTRESSVVPGVPVPHDDADIYRFDFKTGQFDRAFDASKAGLPSGADLDALHVVDPVTFYMSFAADAGTAVPGLGTVMDEDVVLYRAGKFSWFLRGSQVGLGDGGSAEDVDGFHVLSETSVLVSTVGTPAVAGVSGARKQDILRCNGTFGTTTTCSWSMYLDGSTVGLSQSDENVDALFQFDGDIYFSTRGLFSVPGLAGDRSDVSRCEVESGSLPLRCLAFTSFFDGGNFGLVDDLDAAYFVPDAAVDPDPEEFRVVILGSSTAVGTGASSAATSWVGLLDTWLSTVTSRHEVVNLALGGATTEPFRPDGSSPLPDANRDITRASELHPDLIIANFPSNNVGANIPVATTIAHYQEMQAAAAARGIPFLLTTTQPKNFSDYAKRLLLQTEADAVRAEFGPVVIDIYDELTDFKNGLRLKAAYNSGDGTHLNDAGHAYLFEKARDVATSYVTP